MTYKSVVGIDMDGVIANWAENTCSVFNSRFGLSLTPNDFTSYDSIPIIQEKLKNKNHDLSKNKIRDILSEEGFFYSIKPYRDIHYGFELIQSFAEIVIVTKPMEWVNCPSEKIDWLQKHLPDIKYDIVFVDKTETKRHINVNFMIDDDPRVLESLIETKIIPITIRRPWNKEYLLSKDILQFDSFSSAAAYLAWT